jgi:signal transduction histidine kinase
LDEIVWAANPKQDSLEGLSSYLREYIPEFLEPAGMRCHLDFPSPIPNHHLTAQVRHHLFLTVKEALQNVVKHAHATEFHLQLTADNKALVLVLEDNGRGFSAQSGDGHGSESDRGTPNAPLGNGLVNMRERIQRIGGELRIRSAPGEGTAVIVRLPL